MNKDYRIKRKKIQKMINNPNPTTCSYYLGIHFYFTLYKNKSRKLKQKNHSRNNLNMYIYTKIKNWKKSKFDENNLDPKYILV
jgi:galactose mutarotase-like enzyme